MQVGDLVKMVGFIGCGVVTEITSPIYNNNHRVLFFGTGCKELDGYHWCNPTTLEVINENR